MSLPSDETLADNQKAIMAVTTDAGRLPWAPLGYEKLPVAAALGATSSGSDNSVYS